MATVALSLLQKTHFIYASLGKSLENYVERFLGIKANMWRGKNN